VILTLTLNAALDVTYAVRALIPRTAHRVDDVAERAGGKGVNVARVLHALDEPVLAAGLAGGTTGERIRSLLTADGVPEAMTPIAGESRRTISVSDGADSTGFWEPGPVVSAAEWARLLAAFRDHVGRAAVVVLAGSLPRGVPAGAYGELLAVARATGVSTILDADGEPLRAGLAAGPDLVKPNLDELDALVGHPDGGVPAAIDAIRRLGARDVVVSLGADGMVASAVGRDGARHVWQARLPDRLAGNPTGAGDACVAALARGMARGVAWPDRLRDAVALSAAAVAAPVAGSVEVAEYHRLRPSVTIEET
jgi:tagatose 6-phosphate kinase